MNKLEAYCEDFAKLKDASTFIRMMIVITYPWSFVLWLCFNIGYNIIVMCFIVVFTTIELIKEIFNSIINSPKNLKQIWDGNK